MKQEEKISETIEHNVQEHFVDEYIEVYATTEHNSVCIESADYSGTVRIALNPEEIDLFISWLVRAKDIISDHQEKENEE